jgi:hypothetical protein
LFAKILQLRNPTLNLGAIVGVDVLLATQVLPQIGQGRIGPAQIVVASPNVAHKYQHIGVGNAQFHEELGRFLVATLFVEPKGLVGLGVALLVEHGG